MQNRDVARLKRRGDLVQALIGAAEHRLVAQPNAAGLDFTDSRGDAGGFVRKGFEAANFGLTRPRAPIRLECEWKHAVRRAPVRSERRNSMNELFGPAVVDAEFVDHRTSIDSQSPPHVKRQSR